MYTHWRLYMINSFYYLEKDYFKIIHTQKYFYDLSLVEFIYF